MHNNSFLQYDGYENDIGQFLSYLINLKQINLTNMNE